MFSSATAVYWLHFAISYGSVRYRTMVQGSFFSRVLCSSWLCLSTIAYSQSTPIRITADLTDAPRKLFHAEIDLPVKPGPLALTEAAWIPGNHSQRYVENDITGIVFTANGQTIAWQRDDVDLYKFHLIVPPGATTLHVHLDYIANRKATTELAVLEWEDLMLYPASEPVRQIAIQPTVIVPQGWSIATSLQPTSPYDPEHLVGRTVHFAATNVETLEDSPIMAGINFKQYPLNATARGAANATGLGQQKPVFIDVFGDTAEEAVLRPSVVADLEHLVTEAAAMYSSTHYESYHFMLTLTKFPPYGGLEHHESSDNSLPPNALATNAALQVGGPVLSHEYTHSWNGKYRRPAGLATSNFADPMKGELLWVYEGLTDYLGNVLGARCGFMTAADYRSYLAVTAADLDNTSGRRWRSTEDTAISISGLKGGTAWANWRRGADYYPEGDIVWLDVDTTIRKLTHNRKNLHDFLAIFVAGKGSTPPQIVPYGFDELVADLNQVVPYDWAQFLRERVYTVQPHVNVEGIEQGGWKLVYTEQPNEHQQAQFSAFGRGRSGTNVWYSLGLDLDAQGVVSDVRVGSPADAAKLSPGEKILAVNGQVYSDEVMRDAVHATKTGGAMNLIVQNDIHVGTVAIDYHGGERYPHLERIEGTPDYLDEITKPLTPAPATEENEKTTDQP
jgi:predicted metalloprotease with PDZ domain